MRTIDLTLCGFFAALIAVGAFIRIEIPVEPYGMHFTLQWLFVLIAGMLMGRKRATASVGIYLLIGLTGVPVFVSGGGLLCILAAIISSRLRTVMRRMLDI